MRLRHALIQSNLRAIESSVTARFSAAPACQRPFRRLPRRVAKAVLPAGAGRSTAGTSLTTPGAMASPLSSGRPSGSTILPSRSGPAGTRARPPAPETRVSASKPDRSSNRTVLIASSSMRGAPLARSGYRPRHREPPRLRLRCARFDPVLPSKVTSETGHGAAWRRTGRPMPRQAGHRMTQTAAKSQPFRHLP
ncbi:hypothetical protein SAMN06295987_103143 [Novosphingobium mathurense]|uniref:Uncharacterized protein n=1 Tax=Novosphingobium mathurense TaxID=428990 RepID=A0A1U6HV65_9SPHN|nr:hypothetical protein SAMN06295987_103143 [Novosphingobium mathurense]